MNSAERHEMRYQRRKQARLEKKLKRAQKYTFWDNVFGLKPLIDGYKYVSKASKNRTATQIWNANLVVNARKEQVRLENGTWKSYGFNNFTIKERGKWRNISSVKISEKGIQNSFCNNCIIPIIEPHLIYDNGASLRGKGTDFSLREFEKHLREHYRKYGREGGILFFDFSSYFSNIPTIPLTNEIRNLIIDERMMKMYELFVYAFGENGLGLGSQISQISAIFYPNSLDHMMKDDMGIRGYARHMDDGYVIHHDISVLKNIAKRIEGKCNELGIILNKKKCQIVKLTKQFIFLKTRFFVTSTGKIVKRINRKTAQRERHRLNCFRKFFDMEIMEYREIFYNFHSWLLSQIRGKSYHLRLNMIRHFNSLFPEFPPYFPVKVKTRKHKVLKHIAIVAQRRTYG